MSVKNITVLVFVFAFFASSGQSQKLPPGFPDRSPTLDVLPGFKTPPKGYGDVAFYWWQGDTLTRERLAWQLDQLKNKGITSLQINYSHLDTGGISYGLSNPSKPALFTPEWWNLLRWFATESQKRGMTISLSDYTLGIGQGFSMDEAIKENPDLNGSVLKNISKKLSGNGSLELSQKLLTLTAIKMNPDSSLAVETRRDLLSQVKNNKLDYQFGQENWKITGVYYETLIPSYDPMNPQSGKSYCEHFFGKFERELPKETFKNAVNFFFSDELDFRVSGNLWNRYFADEFKKRKGYDLVPYLDALYTNIGTITPKIRIDYNDVLVSLSEDNFFKPVYQWHQDRGLIFGCDHGGRGKNVAEFGDYFRTQRWNQGPGSDQPNLGKDLIMAKVASSIAHMYQRPRVWLEGFYGSGWGTTSSGVTDAIFANFTMGYNLLSFHGLYYSTMGGWWEWAPPCNHFRMPYWKQIDPLMTSVQRLAYTLSQGFHRCDVAIMYPTEPVITDMEGKKSVSIAFGAGTELYSKGIDFDYIDYESLDRAEVKNNELLISGERFKVLVIPSMKVMRQASLLKIEEFKKAGGIVVNIGEQPIATELSGLKDTEVAKLISNVYSQASNLVLCKDEKELVSAISGKYTPDFKILSEISSQPYVMHRIVGNRDIYALYNFRAGTKCFFKAKGNVELWDVRTAEISSLSKLATQTSEGTEITLPLSEKEMQLIVFTNTPSAEKDFVVSKPIKTLLIEGNWEFEVKPSLDNQWGDFQLPATNEMLGAQVRQVYFAENKNFTGAEITFDDSWKKQTCAYGRQFLKLGALSALPAELEILKMVPKKDGETVKIDNKDYQWSAYGFSWQHGVEGDYGHQGYHGLKGKMYDNFIRLGKLEEYKHSLRRVPEQSGNFYFLYSNVIAPSNGTFGILTGNIKPALIFINGIKTDVNATSVSLRQGANPVLLVYDKACETYLVFRNINTPRPPKQPVSMCWYQDYGVLPFDYEGTVPSSGVFVFKSAPGLKSFTFTAYGNVQIWSDGISQKIIVGEKQADGLTAYKVNLANPKAPSTQVVLNIEYQPGYRGMASIPEYFKQTCGTGTIALGDWSEIDGLKAYSGGALYRKTVAISADDLKNKLEIDLGDLVSSAELIVNGKSAGIRLSPPWKFDITSFAKSGGNTIEVMVYNTLANNYTTIPTRYRGSIKSGLIGPVNLIVSGN
jgi:hypothetical protein